MWEKILAVVIVAGIIVALVVVLSSSNAEEVPPPPPPLDYAFFPGWQAPTRESDATRVPPEVRFNNDAILQACRANPSCLAAGSLGWLKRVIPPQNAWRQHADWADKGWGTYIMTDRAEVPAFLIQ